MDNIDLVKQRKSRRTLIAVLLAFALPIILAKLALEQGWLDYGVTNQGELISEELTLEKLGMSAEQFPQQWLILYALPKVCDQLCEQTLESVHNTYVALGREMPRVTPVALFQQQLSTSQDQRLAQSQWQLLEMPVATQQQALQNNMQNQILVVDPLGNVILKHSPPSDSNSLNDFGKQILADMKKLLKYSRVG